ncbi:class I SAM-dependent methyltransferase [Pseudonocardia sp. GCM10023141]|uniref:class I SAM-dependent methyltransferase n=1 Tax=Pseudonocardia sp. GCM10023141 TaxID=3252653 RepID=UPI003619162B
MAASIPRMWTTGTVPNRIAALPSGRLGRLGGRLMRVLNGSQQREVLALLGDVRWLAVRGLAREIAGGRVRVDPGDAADTGRPDASLDLVVSVNTVAIWPELDTGVAELRRVLRPGGRRVLAWDGAVAGAAPAGAPAGAARADRHRVARSLRGRCPAPGSSLHRLRGAPVIWPSCSSPAG